MSSHLRPCYILCLFEDTSTFYTRWEHTTTHIHYELCPEATCLPEDLLSAQLKPALYGTVEWQFEVPHYESGGHVKMEHLAIFTSPSSCQNEVEKLEAESFQTFQLADCNKAGRPAKNKHLT